MHTHEQLVTGDNYSSLFRKIAIVRTTSFSKEDEVNSLLQAVRTGPCCFKILNLVKYWGRMSGAISLICCSI